LVDFGVQTAIMIMMSLTDKKVLLAIPVYNEQENLAAVLDRVGQYIGNVLVIDDGSTDKSKLILAARRDVCVVSHRKNCGYGKTIIQAFNFAAGCSFEWVITMDCDLQHEPRQIPDFLRAIENNDCNVISGSRYMPASVRNDSPPPDRQEINKIVARWINEKLHLNLTDAFCGFKACRVEAVAQLEFTETGYAFPLEFWVQMAHHQQRVREIPVDLIYNDPQRHFGGELDNPDIRLSHYKEVFDNALRKVGWEGPTLT